MAKKKSAATVNKSEAIRAYLNSHTDAMPKSIADALTKELGVVVSPTLVSNIKHHLSQNGIGPADSRKSTAAAPKSPRAATSANVDFDALLAAKELADQLGGLEQARQALESLARLR